MTGRPCEVPTDTHDGTVRLYPGGWYCTSHAPQPRTTEPAAAVNPLRRAIRTRPVDDAPRQVTAALRIDCESKTRPRARYECVTCGWASEAVTGPAAVQAFVSHIRTTHRATCPGAALTEGVRAA